MKRIYISAKLGDTNNAIIKLLENEVSGKNIEILNTNFDKENYALDNPEYLIHKCTIFIAILNKPEQNVYFEIGYAAALAKEIIIISNNEESLPYSVKRFPFIKTDFLTQNYIPSLISIIKNSSGDNQNLLTKYHNLISHSDTKELLHNYFDIEMNYNKRMFFNLKDFLKVYKTFPQILESVSEKTFETMVFRFLKIDHSINSKIIESKKDCGYDLELEEYKGHKKTIVEIKKLNSNSKVSINIILTLANAMELHKAECGILITTSSFTMSARDFAKSLPHKIELWDIKYLEEKLNSNG
ncbi:MAG: restriction endonuclease [Ferruginibacter sp.]